ncbi:uncharacterized protein PAC_19837 [Phialocephala subalpina]|uniref:Uncharacterized protein n=1 Tax=Phialocephala subalpina TaxID=576137 RepID=A0A1L7XY91_9HELO|nr:uncharacterized protein PAC_19837 [Phialocephala subalpina]
MMMAFSSLIRSALLFLILALRSQALTTWNVTSNDFVRMLYSSAIVVGNWLYIDGGEFYQAGASSWADTIHLNGTLSIDMSSSWTTSNVTINTFSKPQQNQDVRDGALWWNPNTSTVLSFGGEPYNTLTGTWALTLDGKGSGTWSQVSFSDPEFNTLERNLAQDWLQF